MEMYHLTEMEGQLEMDLFHNRLNREGQAGQECGKQTYRDTFLSSLQISNMLHGRNIYFMLKKMCGICQPPDIILHNFRGFLCCYNVIIGTSAQLWTGLWQYRIYGVFASL